MSTSRRGYLGRAPGIGLGVVLALALVPPMTAYAADPPPNDLFGNARVVDDFSTPVPAVDLASAGWEDGERWPCGTQANTVWYAFTYGSTNTGAIQVEAPGARVTAFYLPSGSTLTELSAGYCRGTSTLVVPWFANRTDYIQIAGDGSSGPITVTFTLLQAPPNDNLASAQTVQLDSVTLAASTEVDTRLATIERMANDPTHPATYDIPRCFTAAFTYSRSVWYAFEANQVGVLTIDPADSSFADVTLTAYAGDPTPMSTVGCSRPRMPLTFGIWPGTVYYLQAVDAIPTGGTLSGGGLLRLSWSLDAAPRLILPGDITVEATGPTGALVTYEVSAIDTVDGPRPVTCNPRSGSLFPVGFSSVLCSATDGHGSTAIGFVHIMVVDSVRPVLALPADMTVEATGPNGALVSYAASALDAIYGQLPVTCTRPSGSAIPIGRTYVSCNAADPAGNYAFGGFWITVQHTLGPVLTLPAEVVVEAAGASGATATYSVLAVDAVDGPRAVTCDRPSGTTFPLGTTTISCLTSDAAGNAATGSFQVTVRDTTAPTLDFGAHADVYTLVDRIQLACNAWDLVGVTGTTCAGVDRFGWELGLGVHAYGATATDAAGNVGTATTEFSVVATYGSMADLTRQWVSKAGVTKDLLAILEAAAAAEARGNAQAEAGKLADYRALVIAQAGKSITTARATMLVGFSSGL